MHVVETYRNYLTRLPISEIGLVQLWSSSRRAEIRPNVEEKDGWMFLKPSPHLNLQQWPSKDSRWLPSGSSHTAMTAKKHRRVAQQLKYSFGSRNTPRIAMVEDDRSSRTAMDFGEFKFLPPRLRVSRRPNWLPIAYHDGKRFIIPDEGPV
ncbi:hypothetical protein E3N88_15972 [Mikania micrantha]|uniref:Uncharacterized protein n=1 Tax=Mikania micrantha TaxID=192012 RepID=A0A5N6NXI6_9ASTR|nr:hypothetical protein E3N88_15972 [Mikania micrantha]